jgi:uncharacterized protein (TIGR02284 family)
MSADAAVTKDLIQTAEDGKDGYAKGAEKLDSSGSPALAATFRRYSEQRAGFSTELRELAAHYGDDVDSGGSAAAALHRGWMTIKDAVAGSDDPSGVLDTADQGEDHAEKEYDKALAADISPTLRTVVQRQLTEIKTAHSEIKAFRSAHS